VTLSVTPENATDAETVLNSAIPTSSDEAIATVAKNATAGYDITFVAAGSAAITFTSGELTATVAVTVTE